MKTPLPLAKADKAAAQIVEALKPFCEKIESAGSVRRRVPTVGDIDIVCLPAAMQFAALRQRILSNKQIIQDGQQNIHVRMPNGVEINVFVAHPESSDFFNQTPCNYGSVLLCRTGPRQFNIKLIEHAKTKGLIWNPQHGLHLDGLIIAATTEQEIFHALGLHYIPPTERDLARTAQTFTLSRYAFSVPSVPSVVKDRAHFTAETSSARVLEQAHSAICNLKSVI